ncbi:MAG: putative Ribonuclease inhibitor Barstar (Modular protein) [Nitrospira sp.]|nr:putative Ribonuclease inhibitor Barstar (Modular protein) [Nitrospira sp.]
MPLPPTRHLQSTKPPWTMLVVLKTGQRAESAIKIPDGYILRVVRGAKCRFTSELFSEFADAMDFPDYFGHNWDALEECLTDLEWLPGKGYVLLVTAAEQILAGDEEEFATFLEVLSDTGEAWASGQEGVEGKRAKPFHTVLAVSERDQSKRAHWGVPQVEIPTPGSRARRRR